MEPKPKTISDLKRELENLTAHWRICQDPTVQAAIQAVREKNAPRVAELEKQIADLRAAKPAPKPRWPENTPAEVVKFCQEEVWRGTEQSRTFKIFCWNSQAVWTGYPGSAFWSSREQKYGQSHYELHLLNGGKHAMGLSQPVKELSGRVNPKQLQAALDELAGGK